MWAAIFRLGQTGRDLPCRPLLPRPLWQAGGKGLNPLEQLSLCLLLRQTAAPLSHAVPVVGVTAPHPRPQYCRAVAKNRRFLKKGKSITWVYEQGRLDESTYLSLIGVMLRRAGGDELRTVLRRAIGISSRSGNWRSLRAGWPPPLQGGEDRVGGRVPRLPGGSNLR